MLNLKDDRPWKCVSIYTDGACSGNPGPGGWAAILEYKGHIKELTGGEAHTTNNRMELTAVIEALRALKEGCEVDLYCDSRYVIDPLELGWANTWRMNNWTKTDKTPVLNPDLWDILLKEKARHRVRLHWVKGHSITEKNIRCDELAVLESKKFAQMQDNKP